MRKPLLLIAAFVCIAIFSCSKEKSLETGGLDQPPTGGGTGGGTGACINSVVMKLTKLQALFDANQYIRMSWNASSAVDSIVMNLQLTDYLTAHYKYENNRIKETVLLDQTSGFAIVDTVVYRYNAAGKVDSMYRKQGGMNRSLSYDAGGKLTKLTRYESNGDIMYYWAITTDTKGNITKAVEWWNDGTGGFEKVSTYLYSRDDKRSPFANMAPYMLDLDDEYGIFRYWGPNNYIQQTYTDETMGFTLVTGEKNTYNSNCYPLKGQNTIMGTVLFPNEYDWEYFYQ